MERRSNQRRIMNIPIVCSRISSFCSGELIDGVILNTCPDGFYDELKAHVKAGTIIVVRTTGSFSESYMDVGARSQTLAKVRWSEPILVDDEIRYATGIQYVMDY
jgi:hypothetical protein